MISTYLCSPARWTAGAGMQHIYRFPNGFGMSVVRGPYTYGGPEGLWEVAILDADGRLTYTSGITEDVIGHLTWADVEALMERVRMLEPGYEAP